MLKITKFLIIIFIFLNFKVFAKENFFQEAKALFDEGKIEESKFLFQRNIVFNPKDSKSYLYLAKIFETEENEVEEEKNIKDLRNKPRFVKITKAGFYESMVHNIDQILK